MNKDYIYHHGILGQKWGKRNGPPYPLSGSSHTPEERKMGWRKSLDGKKNTNLYDRNEAEQARKRYWKKKGYSNPPPKLTNSKQGKGLTDKQKKILKIGAAAVAVGLASYGAYKFYGDIKAINNNVKIGKEIANNLILSNTWNTRTFLDNIGNNNFPLDSNITLQENRIKEGLKQVSRARLVLGEDSYRGLASKIKAKDIEVARNLLNDATEDSLTMIRMMNAARG